MVESEDETPVRQDAQTPLPGSVALHRMQPPGAGDPTRGAIRPLAMARRGARNRALTCRHHCDCSAHSSLCAAGRRAFELGRWAERYPAHVGNVLGFLPWAHGEGYGSLGHFAV